MKLRNVKEIEAFRAALDKCIGPVWLESADGCRFNLQSKLSQYVALGELLGERGEDLELFCSFPEDRALFFEFMKEYPGVI